MSDDASRKALATRPSHASYEVGFGKPPVETRFKPGRSGNPGGRPRGSRNKAPRPALHEERLKDIILEEAYRTISVTDVRGQIRIPMAQAIVRSLAVNAAKGNQRAQRLFTELLATTERDNRRSHDEWLEVAINYKVEWERELERRRRLGIVAPDPLPHPDHVVIDLRAGTAHIRGPATKEEKAQWDQWLEHRATYQEELRDLKAELADPDCQYRDDLLEEVRRTERVLDIIARALGETDG